MIFYIKYKKVLTLHSYLMYALTLVLPFGLCQWVIAAYSKLRDLEESENHDLLGVDGGTLLLSVTFAVCCSVVQFTSLVK